jgi:hypothetical protein
MRRLPAALALVALIGAGCGNEAAEPSSSTTDSPRDQAVTFSQCMRDNGVSGFPDPDASGELTIDAVLNGSSLDPDAPAWKAAIAPCRDLQPPGFTGRRRTDGQQAASLKFAQCIRDNGVPDFPDPENGAPMVDTNRIPSSATDAGMDALNAAMRTCGTRFGDELGVTAP